MKQTNSLVKGLIIFLLTFFVIIAFHNRGFAENRLLYIGLCYEDHIPGRMEHNLIDLTSRWYMEALASSINTDTSDLRVIFRFHQHFNQEKRRILIHDIKMNHLYHQNRSANWQSIYEKTLTEMPVEELAAYLKNDAVVHTISMADYHFGQGFTGGKNKIHVNYNYGDWMQLGLNPRLTIRELLLDYGSGRNFIGWCNKYLSASSNDKNLVLLHVMGHGRRDPITNRWITGINGPYSLTYEDIISFSRKIINKEIYKKNTVVLAVIDSCNSRLEKYGFTGSNISRKYEDDRLILVTNIMMSDVENENALSVFARSATLHGKFNGGVVGIVDFLGLHGKISNDDMRILSNFTIHQKDFIKNENTLFINTIPEYSQIRNLMASTFMMNHLDRFFQNEFIEYALQRSHVPQMSLVETHDSFLAFLNMLLNKRLSLWTSDEHRMADTISVFYNDYVRNSIKYQVLKFFVKNYILVLIGITLFFLITIFIIFKNRIISYMQDRPYIIQYKKHVKKDYKRDKGRYFYFTDENLYLLEKRIFNRYLRTALRFRVEDDDPFLFHKNSNDEYMKNNRILLLADALDALKDENFSGKFEGDHIENLINNVTGILKSSISVGDPIKAEFYILDAVLNLFYRLYRHEAFRRKDVIEMFHDKVINELEVIIQYGNNTKKEPYEKRLRIIQYSVYLADSDLANIKTDFFREIENGFSDQKRECYERESMIEKIEGLSLASRYYTLRNEPYKALKTGLQAVIFAEKFKSPYYMDYLRRVNKIMVCITALIASGKNVLPKDDTIIDKNRQLSRRDIRQFVKYMKRNGKIFIKKYKNLIPGDVYREYLVTSMSLLRKGLFFIDGEDRTYNRYRVVDRYLPFIVKIDSSVPFEEKLIKDIYTGNAEKRAVAGNTIDKKIKHCLDQNKQHHLLFVNKMKILYTLFIKDYKFSDFKNLIAEAFPGTVDIFAHSHLFGIESVTEKLYNELCELNTGADRELLTSIEDSFNAVKKFNDEMVNIKQSLKKWLQECNDYS